MKTFLGILFVLAAGAAFATPVETEVEEYLYGRIAGELLSSVFVDEDEANGMLHIDLRFRSGALGKFLYEDRMNVQDEISRKYPQFKLNFGFRFPFSLIVTDKGIKPLNDLKYRNEIVSDLERQWRKFGFSIYSIFDHSVYGSILVTTFGDADVSGFLKYSEKYFGKNAIFEY